MVLVVSELRTECDNLQAGVSSNITYVYVYEK